MLIAKTESGGRIYARDAEKGQNYYCQLCNKKLILRKGNIRIHHFAHYTKDADNCHWWETETKLHYQMKDYICTMFKNRDDIKIIEKEYAIRDDTGILIADVYVELDNGDKIAIECQISPKSLDDILMKTLRYSDKNDIYTLWIIPSRDLRRVKKSLEHYLKLLYRGTLYSLDAKRIIADGHIISCEDLQMLTDNGGLKLVGYKGMNFEKYNLEYNYDRESLDNTVNRSNSVSIPNSISSIDNHVEISDIDNRADISVSKKPKGTFIINKEGERLEYKQLVSQVLSMPRFGYNPYDIADYLKLEQYVVDAITCGVSYNKIMEHVNNKYHIHTQETI